MMQISLKSQVSAETTDNQRKPIEYAPEASRGGRESMEMAEGDLF